MLITDTQKEIPKIFYSDLSGAPLHHCKFCNSELKDDTEYLIEKAFKNTPNHQRITLFEYAICFNCLPKMQAKMSSSSKANIAQFFEEKVDLECRFFDMFQEHEMVAEKWLEKCVVNKKNVSESSEFQIYGHFKGKHLVYGVFPYSLSKEVMDELMLQISAESLDEMNGYTEQIFGPDPTLKELFPKNRPILI